MNNNDNTAKTDVPTSWLASINTITATKNKGTFYSNDKNGTSVIIEWQKTSILSPDFATSMKNV